MAGPFDNLEDDEPRGSRRRRDEDDEYDNDERPRRHHSASPESGFLKAFRVYIGMFIALVVLLALGATVAIVYNRNKDKQTSSQTSKMP
jgi:hypothetical protein